MRMRSAQKIIILISATVYTLVTLWGCATAPPPQPKTYIFIPPPPETPRIQFLTSFTDENEFVPQRKSFADFIIGADKSKDRVKAVKKPYGVAIKDGVIYACDTDLNKIDVLDIPGQKFSFIGGTAAGRFKKPINIVIDEDSTKYVTDTVLGGVVVLDKDNSFTGLLGSDTLEKPTGVAVFEDKLFVTDVASNEVVVMNKKTGEVLDRFGKKEQGRAFFASPTNIAVDKDGYLYVAETMAFRIQKVTQQGESLQSFGAGLGDGFGQFARPRGVHVDRQGIVYSIDAWHNVVQMFNAEGDMLLFFGQMGNQPGNLSLPAQVIIDYDNVPFFEQYISPDFEVEYLIIVTSQYGTRKINIFGFGHKKGAEDA